MTREHAGHNIEMARCKRCDHDLVVAKNGEVRCSNEVCYFSRHPHPTPFKENIGLVAK